MDLTSEVLLQCITQKICHDLASPLSTLTLGFESLEKCEISELLQESLLNANSRLALFRSFFSKSSTLSSKEYSSPLKSFLKNKKIVLDLKGEADNDDARILLGFCFLCVDILPRGGAVVLDCFSKKVICTGPIVQNVHFDSYLEDILNPQYKNGIIYYYILSLCLKNHSAVHIDYLQNEANLCLFSEG